MKKLLYLFLIVGITSFGQDEIKMPELDTGNQVYTLEFSPDSQNEEVISAYMQGETEKDSLRFWAEGTIFTQKVMVTVLTENNTDKVKVDIVKNHWEDSKISKETKNGTFQETFDTAGKFGIVITSETPNTHFYLAVWTSGERVTNMNTIYRNASNSIPNTTNSISTNTDDSNQNENSTGILMYVLIGALTIIILLLAIMVFKKKNGKGLTILLLFFVGQQMMFAGAEQFSAPGFGGIGIKYPGVMDIINFAAKLPEMSRNGRLYLDLPGDEDSEANMNPAGGPGVPSSCIPDQFQENEEDEDGTDGRDGIDGRDGRDGRDGTDIMDGNDGVDGNDGIDGGNGNDGIDEDDGKYRPEYDDGGRPKYDKDGIPINYDNSKYPKYDKNGNPIDYGDIDSNGNFDAYGRPRFDKNKSPIEYDNPERPKYDSKGNPINYHPDVFVNPPKRNKDSDFPVDEKLSPKIDKKSTSFLNGKISIIKEFSELTIAINNLGTENYASTSSSKIYTEANILSYLPMSMLFDSDSNREEGCQCLEREYKKLNFRRMNLEKLRIIYAHAMKKINAGIAFGDGVSAVHGVSALVWQNQKMIILKESIPTLNKAYDDKYAEMIEALEENLREIESCEAMLGYENWYNHAGFIYYQFMADKYKRN